MMNPKIQQLLFDNRLTLTEAATLQTIEDLSDQPTIKISQIAELLNVTRRTVSTVLKRLEFLGAISRTRYGNQGDVIAVREEYQNIRP